MKFASTFGRNRTTARRSPARRRRLVALVSCIFIATAATIGWRDATANSMRFFGTANYASAEAAADRVRIRVATARHCLPAS